MSDGFVRVRNENGYESTLSAAYVAGLEGVEVLDDVPATNTWGRPLPATRRNGRPAKKRTTVKKAAASKRAARKKAAPTSDAAANTTTGGTAADSPEEGTE
jgi:hypothetical protein